VDLTGYKLRSDGTYAKRITYGWGLDHKETRTETVVRSAKGKLLRVEGRAKKTPPQPAP